MRFAPNLPTQTIDSILTSFGSDLFLLRECLRYTAEHSRLPSVSDLAEHFWLRWQEKGIQNIESEVKRVLVITSSLGRFDLPISPSLLTECASVEHSIVEKLVAIQILRPVLGMFVLGHRSFSTLIGDWLSGQGVWEEIEKLNGPRNISDMLHYYLRSLSPSKTIDTLRVLHNQSGFKGNLKLSHRTGALIQIWQAFDSVLERILYQQSEDPTWARNPASAMFAVEALCSVGQINESVKSVDFLRSIWTVDVHGNVHIDVTNLPTNEDFEGIGKRMIEEDASIKYQGLPSHLASTESVDLIQMHKNWLLGVLLSAEAAYDRSSSLLEKLVKHTLSIARPSGGFYPERVPWVTARILLGLSSAGVTSAYSPEVRKAVDWLMKDRTRGGAMIGGVWQSGTGSWNSDLEVASMCTLALIRSGIDPSDPRLNTARGLIIANRNNWTNPASILDGALAAEAFLMTGGAWDDIVDEVQRLSQWTKAESFWKSAVKSSHQTFTQSCRVAQIASSLVNIGWTAVRSDLPSLVNAFAVPKADMKATAISQSSTTVQQVVPLPLSTSPSKDRILQTLISMQTISLESLSVVGSYRRHNEKIRNRLKDWYHRIIEPLTQKSTTHENFLVWASPGSGKTFFVQEIARSLNDKIHYAELNLAKMNRDDINATMKSLSRGSKPILCLLDEIDARSDETWPYEEIFSFLDLNLDSTRKVVFILIGSSRNGIEGLSSFIISRSKGKDLLDRIPLDHRFIIPPLDEMDKVALVVSQLTDTAISRGSAIHSIEKICLYYIVTNEQLKSPRQLGDLVISAAQRLPADETRFRYIDLFHRRDSNIYRFWIEHQEVAETLSEVFITIDN